MSEKLGIDSLSKIVKASTQVANVASRLLNKGGLLALLGLQEPIAVLSGVDYVQAKQEILDLSDAERKSLETIISANFVPVNPGIGFGLKDFIDLAENTVLVVEKGVADGHEIYDTVKVLVDRWKSFLGAQ